MRGTIPAAPFTFSRRGIYLGAVTLPSRHQAWKGLKTKTKLHGLSPRANYTDRATAACRRSDCQLLRIEGATWSA
jgi:hypothetical protein